MARQSDHVVQLGAILSDIVADTYALIAEDESDDNKSTLLSYRIACIKASAASLVRHAEAVAAERRARGTTEEKR